MSIFHNWFNNCKSFIRTTFLPAIHLTMTSKECPWDQSLHSPIRYRVIKFCSAREHMVTRWRQSGNLFAIQQEVSTCTVSLLRIKGRHHWSSWPALLCSNWVASHRLSPRCRTRCRVTIKTATQSDIGQRTCHLQADMFLFWMLKV